MRNFGLAIATSNWARHGVVSPVDSRRRSGWVGCRPAHKGQYVLPHLSMFWNSHGFYAPHIFRAKCVGGNRCTWFPAAHFHYYCYE